jgi:hypothetical protein
MSPGLLKSHKRLLLLILLLSAGMGAWVLPESCMAQSVWQLTPYRVQVIVALEQTSEFTLQLESDLCRDLTARIDEVIGAPWDAGVVTPDAPLRHALTADLQSVTVEQLPRESLDHDKVILVAVSRSSGDWQVRARELDVRTRTFNTPVSLKLWQSAKLNDTVLQAVLTAFAPLAKIQETEKKAASLRLRAAALPLRDKRLEWVQAGDLFGPVVRYNDREGNIKRINTIPWTYLVVEKASPELVHCKMITGLRSPLSGRRRGRVEPLALSIIPPGKPTRLTLETQSEPPERLAGYEVYARKPDSKATTLLGHTDWQGSLMIPPAEEPIRIILVKSGGRLLARLPLVPGFPPEQTALMANDDRRLEAEGFNRGMQQRLVDLVVRREVLLSRVRAHIKAGRFDEADKLVAELRRLETRDQFSIALTRGRTRIVSDNSGVQTRIDALFDKTQGLVAKHLTPEPIEAIAHEVAKAREAKSTSQP